MSTFFKMKAGFANDACCSGGNASGVANVSTQDGNLVVTYTDGTVSQTPIGADTISQDITIGNQTFPLGTPLQTVLNALFLLGTQENWQQNQW